MNSTEGAQNLSCSYDGLHGGSTVVGETHAGCSDTR